METEEGEEKITHQRMYFKLMLYIHFLLTN